MQKFVSPIKFKHPLYFGTASEGTYIEVSERSSLDFYIDDVRLTDEFYIVPWLSEEAIIGVLPCKSGV